MRPGDCVRMRLSASSPPRAVAKVHVGSARFTIIARSLRIASSSSTTRT